MTVNPPVGPWEENRPDALAGSPTNQRSGETFEEESAALPGRGYRIPILVSTVAMLVVLFFYWRLRINEPLPTLWIYWGALLLTVLPGLLSGNRLAAGYSVALFVFLQCFSYPFYSPYGFVYFTDPIANLQAATIVAENHFWFVRVGTGPAFAYSFYPAQSFFQVALSFSSGLPLSTTYLYATDLVRFLAIPLAIFKIFRRFIGQIPSLIAVAIFFAVPSNLFTLPVEQEFAYIFLVLAFHAALFAPWAKTHHALSLPAHITTLMFLATVAISHYFTAYVISGFLLILAFASVLGGRKWGVSRRTKVARESASRALLGFQYAAPAYAFIFLLWSIYVSSSIDLGWFEFGQSAFLDALSPGSLSRPGGVTSGVRPGYTYSIIETDLIAAALFLLVVTSIIGVVLLLRPGRIRSYEKPASTRVMLTLFLVGFILLFITAPLVFSRGLYIPLRVLEFAGLGIFPFCAIFFARLLARGSIVYKPLVGLAIAVVVVGGCTIQLANPRPSYLPQSVQYCEMPPHLNSDVLAAVRWSVAHLNYTLDVQVFGDELASDTFGGYGRFVVSAPDSKVYELFNSTTMNAFVASNAELRFGDIVITDSFMTQSICFAGHRTEPFEPAQILKFGASPLFQTVYNNTSVQIHRYVGP